MRKSINYFILIAAMVLLICCSATTALAAEENPIDYEALFAKANEVDG